MDIKILAAILAFLCTVGLALVVYVLKIQIPLLKTIDNKLYRNIRFVFFGAAVFVCAGLVIMLSIDLLTVFFGLRRSVDQINSVGVLVTLLGPIVMDVAIASQALTYYMLKREDDRNGRPHIKR